MINGTKNWITNLGIADFYVVFAVTDTDAGHSRGITAFVVEADRPGFSVGKLEHKLGIRGSPTGQPIFDDVRVPAENLIGERGRGLQGRDGHARPLAPRRRRAGAWASPRARPTTPPPTPRSAGSSASRSPPSRGSSSSSPTWRRSARPARELLYKACAKVDRGDPDMGKYSAMAKLFCSDTAMAVTVEAVQVLGGYGYVKEYPVERLMRDAKITQIYEGTNEIQRLVIARTLCEVTALTAVGSDRMTSPTRTLAP